MRIWAFPSFYPMNMPGRKWQGIFAHRQYQGLIKNGADLKVVIPVNGRPPFPFYLLNKQWKDSSKDYPLQTVYDDIEVSYPRISNMRPSRFFGAYADKYTAAVASMLKHNNITLNKATDIFFSQWLPESYYVNYAAHKLGIKSAILSIGDDVVVWPKSSEGNLAAFKSTIENADVRFACARYLINATNELMGREVEQSVIRWGVDFDFFKPATQQEGYDLRTKLDLPQDKVIILTTGSAIVRKGWLDLFDALGDILKESTEFLLIGIHAGETVLDLTAEAAKRGLKNNFLNLGEVPPATINDYYRAADIFCLPSHWEGLANAVIEAMSTGLPVLTTDVCGHPEIISDGKNGLLIPPARPDMVADRLRKLINDKEYRSELGKNARKHIVECWGNYEQNTATLFQRLQQELK